MIPTELQPQIMMGVFTRYNTVASRLAKYYPTRPSPGPGTIVKYDVLDYRKRLAKIVAWDGPAPTGKLPTRSRVAYEGITLKEALPIPLEVLKKLCEPGSMTEVSREQNVSRAIRQLRLDFERTWEFLRAQWMTAGALVDSSNAIPGTASGTVYVPAHGTAINAPQSVDLGMTATHIDSAVAASWATSTTDIKGDLSAMAAIIEADSGVAPDTVIMNKTTFDYVLGNDDVTASEAAKLEMFRTGTLKDFWGYTWDIIDETFPIDTEFFNDTAGSQKLIPDNVVVLTTSNNDLAGRFMLECEPSDAHAPVGHRGVFAWTDEEKDHPHTPIPGMEWSGGPVCENPDATGVFVDVTSTG